MTLSLFQKDVLTVYVAIGLCSVVLMLAEWLYDYQFKRPRNHENTLVNFEIGIVFYGLQIVIAPLAAYFFSLADFRLIKIPSTPWTFLICLLLTDFGFYWVHRLKHNVRFLWATHITHHSGPEYNVSLSFRLPWIGLAMDWVFILPLIWIGFDLTDAILASLLVGIGQHWLHTNKIAKLGFLEGIINTPSAHRVHHLTAKQFHNKNFGGLLIIWDRLFGTYQTELEVMSYGSPPHFYSTNPLHINFHEIIAVTKDAFLKKEFGLVFQKLLRFPEEPK